MEGTSGVGHDEMLDGDEFRLAQEMITADVNACVRGIRRSEPNAAIDLFDAHGLGGNVLEEELEPAVHLLGGGWVDILFPLVSEGGWLAAMGSSFSDSMRPTERRTDS